MLSGSLFRKSSRFPNEGFNFTRVWVLLVTFFGFFCFLSAPAGYGFDSYQKFEESKKNGSPLVLEALPGKDHVRPGESFWLVLVAELDQGWHMYSLEIQDEDETVATQIDLKVPGFRINGEWQETPPRLKRDEVLQKVMKTHTGRVEFSRKLEVPGNLKPGAYPLSGTLRFRTCDNRICTLPQTVPFQTRVIVETPVSGP